jgi:hypothetical protein
MDTNNSLLPAFTSTLTSSANMPTIPRSQGLPEQRTDVSGPSTAGQAGGEADAAASMSDAGRLDAIPHTAGVSMAAALFAEPVIRGTSDAIGLAPMSTATAIPNVVASGMLPGKAEMYHGFRQMQHMYISMQTSEELNLSDFHHYEVRH